MPMQAWWTAVPAQWGLRLNLVVSTFGSMEEYVCILSELLLLHFLVSPIQIMKIGIGCRIVG